MKKTKLLILTATIFSGLVCAMGLNITRSSAATENSESITTDSKSLTTFTISGNVKADGANLAGATVSLGGATAQSVSTDAAGNYSLTVNSGGSYTVSVTKKGFSFTPANQSFANLQNNQTANFQNGVPLCAPPPSGLVGWWRAENNANESSNSEYNGTLVNSVAFGAGKVGQGFILDGIDDYVQIDNQEAFDQFSQITLMAWVKFNSLPNNDLQFVLADSTGTRDGNYDAYAIWFDSTVSPSVIRANIRASDSVQTTFSDTAEFHHVAVVYNGTSIALYLDGQLKDTLAFSGGRLPFSPLNLTLGRRSGDGVDGQGDLMNGILDETQVYSRALSVNEIQEIYNSKNSGICTSGATFTNINPNGKIAFFSGRLSGRSRIFTMNSNGSNQTEITQPLQQDNAFSWSPDGSKIAFVSFRNDEYELYTVNADGTNLTKLETNLHPFSPSWSSDGRKIYFSHNEIGGGIHVVNADGTNLTTLTTTSSLDRSPDISGDSSKIVFESQRNSNSEIYVMNSDGSNPTRLTNNTAYDGDPEFSPDSTKIIFTSYRNGNYQIYIMNADGSNQINLSNNLASEYNPSWSPDGNQIVFSSFRSSNDEIYSMNTDGGNQVRLTTNSYADSNPTWQPILNYVEIFPTSGNQLTFTNVTKMGNTIATALTSSQIPALPNGFTLPASAPIYDIRTSAEFSGNVAVKFDVPNVADAASCSRLRSVHFVNGTWTDGSDNAAPQYNAAATTCTVSQTVTSLSPFAVVQTGAQNTGTINVSMPSNLQSLRNGAVTVPVTVSDTTGSGIISFDFSVSYDPNVLTTLPTAFDSAGTLSSGFNLNVNSTNAGVIRVSGYGTAPLAGAGTLLNLKFTATGTAPACGALTFTDFQFNDGTPSDSTSNGQVCIINGSVTGAVTNANTTSNLPVPDVTLNAAGSSNFSTTTNSSGNYLLSNFGSGNYTVTPSKTGGINGAVASFDASLISRFVVGLETLNTNQRQAADVSGSTTVNSFDAALIAQYLVGIANPGNAGTWKFTPVSRSYTDLSVNHTDQNYTAILMGDVSGNWTAPSPFAEPENLAATPPTDPIRVSLPSSFARRNEIITVPITVGDTTGRGVFAYDFEVNFNSSVLQLDSVEPVSRTGTVSSQMSVTANSTLPSRLIVSAYGSQPIAGTGTLLNLRFRVVGAEGSTSPLTWQRFLMNEDPNLSTTQNGQIQVLGAASNVAVGGRVMTAGGAGIKRAMVVLTDANGVARTTTAGSFGYYRFEGVPVGATYTVTVVSKKHSFNEPVRVISVASELTNVDFIAND